VKSNNWQQVLVFTRTKHGANRLAQQLERDGIVSDAIHGNKSQGARTRALKRFKNSELQVLVATDIAARGLDIEELPHVVNYDLPHVAEDYVHRIGRTGRAGASGQAVSLVSAEDRSLLSAVERLINRRIEQKIVAGFELGSRSNAPAQPHDSQRPPRQEHRRQGNGQQRHRDGDRGGHNNGQQRHRDGGPNSHSSNANKNGSGNGGGNRNGSGSGNRQPQRGQQQRRHGSHGSAQGQPHRPHRQHQPQGQHHQPVNARPLEQDEERQPSPEQAGNQLFPGLLGGLGRKFFGRKPR
jgi:ATP-dependent RNA helicase RhlE